MTSWWDSLAFHARLAVAGKGPRELVDAMRGLPQRRRIAQAVRRDGVQPEATRERLPRRGP